jgi:NADH-quinone oxidoreductase subunit N
MVVMAASNDLITVFLGLELMSLALYVMVGSRRGQLESNEAALKYFLLGAFASGFLLYGIALIYGATGSTNLRGIVAFMSDSPLGRSPLFVTGALLLIVGFGFKVAAVPFHMWTPDAYEGAPTSVTAFMSAGAKAAGFAALLRVAGTALAVSDIDWRPLLSGLAILSMTVGNVTALLQTNVKRMLAYSSIAHAGYVLVALAAGGSQGTAAALFYLAVYSFMNLGAFGILALLGRGQDERVLVSDLAGLGFRQPLLGIAMTVFMISLGGIPPTAGFMGKIYVFGAALDAGLVPLVIIGVLNSVISVFYYLRITVAMYMSEEPAGGPVEVSWAVPGTIALIATLVLTLWWGIQAQALLVTAQESVRGLL